MANMRDSHRLFLQSFMSKGIIDGKQVRELHKLACRRFQEDDADLVEFVSIINEHIKPIHLEIKKAISEESAKQSYCLVNTADTEFTRLAASDYSQTQLELFKRLVEKVVEAENGTVSSTEALNLPDIDPVIKILKKDAEACYDRMQREQWIGQNEDGQYFLTARSILELEQYIRDQYPNLCTMCNMCNKLVLQGQSCANCDVKLHIGCAAKYFEGRGDNVQPKCPSQQCRANWPHPIPNTKKHRDGHALTQTAQVAASQSQRESRKRKARH